MKEQIHFAFSYHDYFANNHIIIIIPCTFSVVSVNWTKRAICYLGKLENGEEIERLVGNFPINLHVQIFP